MLERRDGIRVDRRLVIGGIAAAASLPLMRSQAVSRIITQRGIAGGGLVRFAEGEAQFSLSASSLTTTEDGVAGEPVFLGSVLWVDGSVGLTLESTVITNYENLNLSEGEGRLIEGEFATPDSGDQPFAMEVVHFGPPGSGADRVTLTVGAANAADAATPGADSAFTYAADGEIVVGDVQTADFEVDLETGEANRLVGS